MKLYPHQEKAVGKLRNGSILWGGVGTGKSKTAVAYYERNEAPKDVYVITTAKKRDSLDWVGEFADIGVSTVPLKVSGMAVGTLTVDSWNNVTKYTKVKNAFFIFDEQRLVGSGTWVRSFRAISKQNSWILLTATPGDTWLDYIPVFVANGYYKNRTEFLREHVVYSQFTKFPKVERYTNVTKLVRQKNALLVEMPYVRHTVREFKDVWCSFDKDLLGKALRDRWHVYEGRPLRDAAEMFLVMRKIVNSDVSRVEAIRSLMKNHPRLIVFYNFDYELDQLRKLGECTCSTKHLSLTTPQSATSNSSSTTANREMLSSSRQAKTEVAGNFSDGESQQTESSVKSPDATGNCQAVPIAEWNGHKHDDIPDSDRWVYLVQYTAGAEGWNCTATDCIAFYSLTYSYRAYHQAQGRIDRLNTPFTNLHYYVLKSKSVMDNAIWDSLKTKQNFNERHFAAMWGKTDS